MVRVAPESKLVDFDLGNHGNRRVCNPLRYMSVQFKWN